MQSKAKFVLVIEKDATFQKLLDDNIFTKLGPCILITVRYFCQIQSRVVKLETCNFSYLKRLIIVFSLQVTEYVNISLNPTKGQVKFKLKDLTVDNFVWIFVL